MARNHPTALYLNDPVKWIAGVLSIRQALSLAGVAVLTYVLIKVTGGLPYNSSTVGQVHLLLVAGVPGVLGFLAWSLLDKGAVEPYPRQLAGYLLRTAAALPARGATTAQRIRVANIERARAAPPQSPWSPRSPWSSRLPRLAPVVHLVRRARPGSPVRAVPASGPIDLTPAEARSRGGHLNREARRWCSRAPRVPRVRRRSPAALADDGTLTCPGVGPRVWLEIGEGAMLFTLPGEAQDRFTAMFASVATLPPGYSLQCSVLSTPLPPTAVIDDAFAAVRPPTPALADLAARLRAWWEAHLRGQYVPKHRFLLVVTGPARPAGAAMGTSLEQVAGEVQRGLRRMGVATRRLDGPEVQALLDAYPDGDTTETIDEVHAATARDRAFGASGRRGAHGDAGNAGGTRDAGDVGGATGDADRPAWYACSFYVVVPPRATNPGWPAPLLAFPAPLRLAIHITGLDQDKERSHAKKRSRGLADVAVAAAVRGREADVDAQAARGEARAQALHMRSAGAAVLKVGLYVTVFAPDRASLRTRADALWSLLTSSGGIDAKGARARGHQGPLAAATRPLGLDPARSTYKMEAETVANAWPAISHTPGTAAGIPIGRAAADGSLVRLHLGDRSMKNRLIDVFGGSGQGKSFWAQIIMTWFLLWDAWATAVDTVGGYATLCAIADGRTIRLGGPRTASINIWDGPRATEEDRAARVQFVVKAHEVLLAEEGRAITGRVRSVIGAGVRAVYDGFRAPPTAPEATPETATATAEDRPTDGTPLERDLVAWLEVEGAAQADHEDKRLYRDVAADLYPYVRGGEHARLVDRKTSFRIDTRLLAFHIDPKALSPTTPVYAFVMFAMTDLADRRDALAQEWGRRTGRGTVQHLLAIDEGWSILRHQAGQDWVNGIGLTGRHTGIVPIFISQKLSHLTGSPAASNYFDQSSLHFIFNLHDTNDESGVDPRAWIARKLRLTEAESARIEELEGEEGRYAQMFMIRTTKHAARAARGVVNVHTTPELLWLFASDKDDKELRARMVQAVAADPEQPTADETWKAVCLLASGTRPGAIEDRRARIATLGVAADVSDAGDAGDAGDDSDGSDDSDDTTAETADDTEEARLWLVRHA